MRKIEITFTVSVPDGIGNDDQLEEFLRYIFNDNGCCAGDNPYLMEHEDIEPDLGTFYWEDV